MFIVVIVYFLKRKLCYRILSNKRKYRLKESETCSTKNWPNITFRKQETGLLHRFILGQCRNTLSLGPKQLVSNARQFQHAFIARNGLSTPKNFVVSIFQDWLVQGTWTVWVLWISIRQHHERSWLGSIRAWLQC